MKQVLFATKNVSKVNRFKDDLEKSGIKVITLNDININLEVDETGTSAIENALIKARAYYEKTSITTIATDDNLTFENVPDNFQPGTYVRRVNGKVLTDEEMIDHYINLVREFGTNGKLTARWLYGMALIKNGKEYTYTWSNNDFYLVDKPSSKIKPGYPLDSISIDRKHNKYFTDLSREDKLSLEENENHVVQFIIDNI